jgi:hypothetical protein
MGLFDGGKTFNAPVRCAMAQFRPARSAVGRGGSGCGARRHNRRGWWHAAALRCCHNLHGSLQWLAAVCSDVMRAPMNCVFEAAPSRPAGCAAQALVCRRPACCNGSYLTPPTYPTQGVVGTIGSNVQSTIALPCFFANSFLRVHVGSFRVVSAAPQCLGLLVSCSTFDSLALPLFHSQVRQLPQHLQASCHRTYRLHQNPTVWHAPAVVQPSACAAAAA